MNTIFYYLLIDPIPWYQSRNKFYTWLDLFLLILYFFDYIFGNARSMNLSNHNPFLFFS